MGSIGPQVYTGLQILHLPVGEMPGYHLKHPLHLVSSGFVLG